jgi:hypothetical protein
MGASIEAGIESQRLETVIRKEVTCLFCGLPTPVPASGPSRFGSHVPRRISIVRCRVCGKEAPYRSCDIFEFAEECQAPGF